MTCEINELQIYEKSFFEQKRKNDELNQRNHELEIDRSNILSVN